MEKNFIRKNGSLLVVTLILIVISFVFLHNEISNLHKTSNVASSQKRSGQETPTVDTLEGIQNRSNGTSVTTKEANFDTFSQKNFNDENTVQTRIAIEQPNQLSAADPAGFNSTNPSIQTKEKTVDTSTVPTFPTLPTVDDIPALPEQIKDTVVLRVNRSKDNINFVEPTTETQTTKDTAQKNILSDVSYSAGNSEDKNSSKLMKTDTVFHNVSDNSNDLLARSNAPQLKLSDNSPLVTTPEQKKNELPAVQKTPEVKLPVSAPKLNVPEKKNELPAVQKTPEVKLPVPAPKLNVPEKKNELPAVQKTPEVKLPVPAPKLNVPEKKNELPAVQKTPEIKLPVPAPKLNVPEKKKIEQSIAVEKTPKANASEIKTTESAAQKTTEPAPTITMPEKRETANIKSDLSQKSKISVVAPNNAPVDSDNVSINTAVPETNAVSSDPQVPAPNFVVENQIWYICSEATCDCSVSPDGLTYSILRDNSWQPSSFKEFANSNNPELPNLIFIHGNLTNSEQAIQEAFLLYCRIINIQRTQANAKPFRLIIWKWHSQKTLNGIRKDSLYKADLADQDGICLARLLETFPKGSSATVVAFSFGARIFGIAANYIAEHNSPINGKINGILILAAADYCDYASYGRFIPGMTALNSLTSVYNPTDKVLRLYPLMYGIGGPKAAGMYPLPLSANLSGGILSYSSENFGPEHKFKNAIYALPDNAFNLNIFEKIEK